MYDASLETLDIHVYIYVVYGTRTCFPSGSTGKESTCQRRRCGFNPWARKIPWRRKWKPTPVFLPGKSHGQRRLVGYSPQGCEGVGHSDLATKQQQYVHTTRYKWIFRRYLKVQSIKITISHYEISPS